MKVPSARVLVDADACPVRREIELAAKCYGIEALFFANSSQETSAPSNLRTVRVDDRPDAADFEIATQCRERDIVVTDDIGLAALATGKGARAISCRGRLFRPDVLPLLLEERHRSRKLRRAGGRTRGPRTLTEMDRARFVYALGCLLFTDKPNKEALQKFDRALASPLENVRWKAASQLSDYCVKSPETIWPLLVKWGSSDDEDARSAIACCVLEHILEYHFDDYFEKCVRLIREGNLNLCDTLSKCCFFGEASRPANAKKLRSLLKKFGKTGFFLTGTETS